MSVNFTPSLKASTTNALAFDNFPVTKLIFCRFVGLLRPIVAGRWGRGPGPGARGPGPRARGPGLGPGAPGPEPGVS